MLWEHCMPHWAKTSLFTFWRVINEHYIFPSRFVRSGYRCHQISRSCLPQKVPFIEVLTAFHLEKEKVLGVFSLLEILYESSSSRLDCWQFAFLHSRITDQSQSWRTIEWQVWSTLRLITSTGVHYVLLPCSWSCANSMWIATTIMVCGHGILDIVRDKCANYVRSKVSTRRCWYVNSRLDFNGTAI